MSFHVHVLCTDALDSTACLVIATDSHRVIINCGEGVQRLCVEHKIRLGKITHVLTTNSGPRYCFGLPGLALTMVDAGNAKLSLCGADDIPKLLAASRHFMKLPDGMATFAKPLLEGSGVDVAVKSTELFVERVGLNHDHCCFIGHTPELAGKFDVKKAQQFPGLRRELYGQLKSGKCVTLEDGQVVRPEDVLDACVPSKHFAVVSCIAHGDEALLGLLFDHSEFNRHKQRAETAGAGQHQLHCMIHLSPALTVSRSDYAEWMHSFGPSTTHILCGAAGGTGLSGGEQSRSAFWATTTQCNKLHLAVPGLFPQLRTEYGTGSSSSSSSADNQVRGVPGMRYTFLPLRSLGLSSPATAGSEAVDCVAQAQALWAEALSGETAGKVHEARAVLTKVQAEALGSAAACESDLRDLYGFNSEDASILRDGGGGLSFLGTGCAVPSKYRNVSGILLDLPRGAQEQEEEGCAMLIDVGEGTWSQMLRLLCETHQGSSVAQLKERLARRLRVVWVSHPHADHHLGLVRVIAERWAALSGDSGMEETTREPLLVVAPPGVLAFLRDYSSSLDKSLSEAYIGVSCRDFDPHDDCRYTDVFWNDSLVDESASSEIKGVSDASVMEVVVEEARIDSDVRKIQESDESASGREHKRPKLEASTSLLGPGAAEECAAAGGAASGGRAWRNYRSVFREELSPAAMQARRAARAKADVILAACGVGALTNVQVVHCGQSYGLCLEVPLPVAGSPVEGSQQQSEVLPQQRVFKLVYSGDTRPCERLVEAGRGATVLIHEATFEDDKAQEAVNKRHSTFSEAREVGRQMGAFRVILTHFSQRYPGVPQLEPALPVASAIAGSAIIDNLDAADSSLALAPIHAEQPPKPMQTAAAAAAADALPPPPPVLAFDFMQLALRDLLWAPAATPLLAAAYPAGSTNTLQAAGAKGIEDD